MKFLRLFVLLPCLFAAAQVLAQGYFHDHKLPFYRKDGTRIRNALAGGIASPSISQVDLNNDGWPELVLFEREDSSFSVYRNLGRSNPDTWRYDPVLSTLFDDCPCRSWALMRDYNADGLPDLFCSNQTGNVRVFRQERQGGIPVFPLAIDEIQYDYGDIKTTGLYVPNTDLPAITDVDHDGDLDILTFSGTDNVLGYYRNVADSLFPGQDTMFMIQPTICWGKFSESQNDNTILLHDPADECQVAARPANPNHVAGSTILALDLDNDQDQDLILGDEGSNYVLGLINYGTPTNATIGQVEDHFPSASPILINNYVAVYQADADNNGTTDLVSSPAKYVGVENYNALTLHSNTTNNLFPSYQLQQKGFLHNTTLDVGQDAAPAFIHLNQDTLPDLLVGNYSYYQPGASVPYPGGQLMALLNTGTAANPAFTLADRSFLGLPALSALYQEAVPAAADLDGDGDQDLVIGSTTGILTLFRNTGMQGGMASFQLVAGFFSGIDVGENAAPFFHDLDKDGDQDLLIGNKSGYIWYYQNTGTAFAPVWTLVTAAWGKVKMRQIANSPLSSGYARPVIADYDQNGTEDLLVGEVNGTVRIFPIGAPTDSFLSTGKLWDIDAGRRATPAAARLDATGNLTWIVGNQRGGLHLWRTLSLQETDTVVSVSPVKPLPHWTLYPNPAAAEATLSFPGTGPREIVLRDLTGKAIHQTPCESDTYTIPLQAVPAGIYLVVVTDRQGSSTRLLSVTR